MKKKTLLILSEDLLIPEQRELIILSIYELLKKDAGFFDIYLEEECIEILSVLSSISILGDTLELASKLNSLLTSEKIQSDIFILEEQAAKRTFSRKLKGSKIEEILKNLANVVIKPYFPYVPEDVQIFYKAKKSIRNELYLMGWSEKMLEEMTDYDSFKKLIKQTETKSILMVNSEPIKRRCELNSQSF